MWGIEVLSAFGRGLPVVVPSLPSQFVWHALCEFDWLPFVCSVKHTQVKIERDIDQSQETYGFDNHRDTLFVTFHLQKCFDLVEGQVFTISQIDHLIESADQLKCIP